MKVNSWRQKAVDREECAAVVREVKALSGPWIRVVVAVLRSAHTAAPLVLAFTGTDWYINKQYECSVMLHIK